MLRFSYLLGCARSDFVNILRCSNTPAKLFWAETCFFCLRSSFLYLMGLVDYHPKTDAFEYVGPNEGL